MKRLPELRIGQFSEIVSLPHIMAEVSSLSRQINDLAKRDVREALKILIEICTELPIASIFGIQRSEFHQLDLTDGTILHLCTINIAGKNPNLITTNNGLANNAISAGHSVVDYKLEYQTK